MPLDALIEATARAEAQHFWFRGFRRFVRPLLARATEGAGSRAELLDCGCGTGANMRLLAEFGRPFGIDLTWRGLSIARESGQMRTAQGTVTRLPFGSDRFHVVTSFDVLYCLQDEAEGAAIAEMFRVLRPGGWAVVNVAALEVLRGGHSLLLGGEVRRYSTGTLRAALERAGFTIDRLTYTNAVLFPLLLPVRMGKRLTGLGQSGNQAGAELSVPPGPVNWLLDLALRIEAAAVKVVDLPVGTSVLCLARKPLASPLKGCGLGQA